MHRGGISSFTLFPSPLPLPIGHPQPITIYSTVTVAGVSIFVTV